MIPYLIYQMLIIIVFMAICVVVTVFLFFINLIIGKETNRVAILLAEFCISWCQTATIDVTQMATLDVKRLPVCHKNSSSIYWIQMATVDNSTCFQALSALPWPWSPQCSSCTFGSSWRTPTSNSTRGRVTRFSLKILLDPATKSLNLVTPNFQDELRHVRTRAPQAAEWLRE